MTKRGLAILCGLISLNACSTEPPAPRLVQPGTASILVASSPRAGAVIAGAVDRLELHFNPPARLDEVTVTGPDGTMPIMVHAVGEVVDYSVPLPGLGAGNYTVAWKAFSAGREAHGTFTFTVK